MTRCFSDSAGPLASQAAPPPQRGTRGQHVEKSPVPRSPRGQKLLQDLGLSEDFPAVPGPSKAATQQGGQLDEEMLGSTRGRGLTRERRGPISVFTHQVQVSVLQLASLSPP